MDKTIKASLEQVSELVTSIFTADIIITAKENWTPAQVDQLGRLLCSVMIGKDYAEVTEAEIAELMKEKYDDE